MGLRRIFVLGAGCSVHANLPTADNILKKYIKTRIIKYLSNHLDVDISDVPQKYVAKELENITLEKEPILSRILSIQPNSKFINNSFDHVAIKDLYYENLPNIEDIFTLYDIAHSKDESLLYESNIDINHLRQDALFILVFTITQLSIMGTNSNFSTDIYQQFADQLTKEDIIISYNYDLLLDNAILNKFQEINYGVDFMNNQSSSGLKLGSNAPLLLKPHGSLNWYYCPKCYTYYCLNFSDIINKETYFFSSEQCYCGNEEPNRVITPLTYYKTFQNPLLNILWMKINQQLSIADKVYFVGYSMPDADYMSKYYFIKGLARPHPESCAKITVVLPNAEELGLSKKYKKIFGELSQKFDVLEQKFEDWIQLEYV